MLRFIFFCLVVLLNFNKTVCFAQLVNMPSMPYGNRYGGKGNVKVNSKYEFMVRLKNDSAFRVKARINSSSDKHFITVKKNKQEIIFRPNETKSISHISEYNGYAIIGIPSDSCWLFMVNKGRINSYSFIPDEVNLCIIAIQKGNGPIVALTKKELQAIVGENPKLLKLIEAGDFLKVIENYNKQ